MFHDVTIDIHTPGRAAQREIVQVWGVSGDDAAAKGKVEAVRLSGGRAWKIVGVAPSENMAPNAPVASLEGDDVGDDPTVPDELEPPRRGPGRPRKVVDAT